MVGKGLFLTLAAGALLLLPLADCTSAMAPDQQSMACCKSMHCMPGSHGSKCCRSEASPETPNLLPSEHVSLHGPDAAAVEQANLFDVPSRAATLCAAVEAPQHSPPELYTLHASLLI